MAMKRLIAYQQSRDGTKASGGPTKTQLKLINTTAADEVDAPKMNSKLKIKVDSSSYFPQLRTYQAFLLVKAGGKFNADTFWELPDLEKIPSGPLVAVEHVLCFLKEFVVPQGRRKQNRQKGEADAGGRFGVVTKDGLDKFMKMFKQAARSAEEQERRGNNEIPDLMVSVNPRLALSAALFSLSAFCCAVFAFC